MAAMATIIKGIQELATGAGKSATVSSRVEMPQARTAPKNCKLPPFPNEDVYFYAKRIDNSMVVREEDPSSGGNCWRAIGGIVMGSLVFTGLLLPSAYRMVAGYQIHQLKDERQSMLREMASLKEEEARLMDLKRMEEIAVAQLLIDPPTGKIQHLSSKGSLAMNKLPSGK